jgi:hypothetical protein
MCIDGQLLTDVHEQHAGNGSNYMMNISEYFNHSNGYGQHSSAQAIDCKDLHRIAEDFHSFTTLRFKKFFGIKSEYAYLYVKEAEFVYNEKDYALREKVLNKMADRIFL